MQEKEPRIQIERTPMEEHPNLQRKCIKCGEFSVNTRHCKLCFNKYIKPRFGKFITYLLFKRNLNQNTVFSYIAVLEHLDYEVLKNFTIQALKVEINTNPYNMLRKSTISKNRAAILAWLNYVGIDEALILQTRKLFQIKKELNYSSRLLVETSNKVDKEETKYLDYEVITEKIITSCEKKRVRKKIRTFRVENDPDRKEVLRKKAYVLLLLNSGIRAKESVWSKVKHLDDTGLVVLAKGFKLIHVRLNKETIKVLRKYIKVFKLRQHERLFTFEGFFNKDRNETYQIQIDKEYQKYFKKEELEGLKISSEEFYYLKRQSFLANRFFDDLSKIHGYHLTPHMMRHSIATHLTNSGVPIEVIQKLLGHSRIETTQRYAKLKAETIDEHYDRVLN